MPALLRSCCLPPPLAITPGAKLRSWAESRVLRPAGHYTVISIVYLPASSAKTTVTARRGMDATVDVWLCRPPPTCPCALLVGHLHSRGGEAPFLMGTRHKAPESHLAMSKSFQACSRDSQMLLPGLKASDLKASGPGVRQPWLAILAAPSASCGSLGKAVSPLDSVPHL